MDEFARALEEAGATVQEGLELAEERLPKFLLFLLYDSYRTAVGAQVLIERGLEDPRIAADSVEVLARKILEAAILCRYARKHASDAVVDRFLKTYATEWEKSWQVPPTSRDVSALPAKNLPSYRQMAEDVRGDIYDAYRKLSYLSHPRGALPYSLVEHESGLGPKRFFRRRVDAILPCLAQWLIILTSNFRESQDQGVGS